MGTHSSTESKPSKTAAHTSSRLTVLPDDEALTLLGLCWLSASTGQSFSPSRWLPSSASTVADGARPNKARCFTVSSHLVKDTARKKNKFMVTNGLTVRSGLTLTSHSGITIAAYNLSDLGDKTRIQVGGVHIDVRGLQASRDTKDSAVRMPFVTFVTLWRAELEMDPPQYVVLEYQRHPVRAPPATEAERQQYGEGCITGLRYGSYVVLRSSAPIESDMAALLREQATDSEAVDVTLERTVAASSADPWQMAVCEACARGDNALTALATVDRGAALAAVADWCSATYHDARRWSVVSLFMQRYEAIGECLLRK